jgi:bacterial/archaeal transporter family protein
MWIFYAALSALFAGLTTILAKCGIQKTDADMATALRTGVVLVFSWLIVFLTGAQQGISTLQPKTIFFLVLSGAATGASWLCYFRALQLGEVQKVAPIDKSSVILTILLSLAIFHEGVSWTKAGAIILIAAGTLIMVRTGRKDPVAHASRDKRWLIYAILSAVFASLTSVLGKVGVTGISSNLGTALRTIVVLIMAWLVVLIKKRKTAAQPVSRSELGFICLSGIATGGSWLCYWRALQQGPASVVVPIDKLSIVVTVLFSAGVFHEKLTKKTLAGLVLITTGTIALAVFTK